MQVVAVAGGAGHPPGPGMKAAILTISTSVAAGRSEDTSGKALAELATAVGAEIVANQVVADDRDAIEAALRQQVRAGTPLILTTGGTGLTPDDVTPEATRAVIDRDAPGFAEAMRAESLRHTPMGILSRGVSGIAHRSLIINFPGNPKAIRELFGVISPVLEHAVATLQRDRTGEHEGHGHGGHAGHGHGGHQPQGPGAGDEAHRHVGHEAHGQAGDEKHGHAGPAGHEAGGGHAGD